MFGFGLNKRVERIDKVISKISVIPTSGNICQPYQDIDEVVIGLRMDIRKLEDKIKMLERDNSIQAVAPVITIGTGLLTKWTDGVYINPKDAIQKIAEHLGLKFEVEPAKGEQVKLVKVKK